MELATISHERFGDIQELTEKYNHPMMSVLQAAASGLQVIDAHKTFALAGFKDGLPRLAFSRTAECQYVLSRDRDFHLFGEVVYQFSGNQHGGLSIPSSVAYPHRKGLFGPMRNGRGAASRTWETICPPVPTSVLQQKRNRDLFCWEVGKWEPAPQLEDPVLLRPLYKQFYAVIAQWDLTPLEKELFSLVL